MDVVARLVKAFGHFWWDFLIGDTPEIFVAALIMVGAAFALSSFRVAATICLPLLCGSFLIASTLRGHRRAVAQARSRSSAEAGADTPTG
jgi:hypothetical protein